MVIEHEVISNVADEPNGRPLEWVCRMVRDMGRPDPFTMLQQMTRAGYLVITDEAGEQLPQWRCEEIWREGDEACSVNVVATDLGVEWGYS